MACWRATIAHGQSSILRLYPDSVPNATKYTVREEVVLRNDSLRSFRKVSQPLLYVYRPDAKYANGTAVIICAGGSYNSVNIVAEGFRTAEAFVRHGVTAIVLKYRLPNDSIMRNKSIGPLQDAQQAIKTVRQHVQAWNLDTNKIGIMGFSAGGHLAATAATHFKQPVIPFDEGVNLRPDFAILIYPVISFSEPILHKPSRTALIGAHPSQELINYYSIEQQVTEKNPPTWIAHTGDDRVVPVANAIKMYEALVQHKVAAELHVYPKGDHGFVLRQPVQEWMRPLLEWMKENGWMRRR